MTRKPYTNCIIIAILILIILNYLPSLAQASTNKQVTMIIINQVNYEDLLEMDATHTIIHNGGIGLLNTRASGSSIAPKSYATIGAGIRAEGNWETAVGQASTEENRAIYYARTGKDAPKDGIINVEINKLINYNNQGQYGATAGQLGSILRQSGLATAAYGNMDTLSSERRPHIFIAMDEWGRVDYGDISKNILIEDPYYPGGLRTDFEKIHDYIIKNNYNASLNIIETGDISRLEAEKENLSPEMYEYHKKNTLQEMDKFIQKIKRWVDKENHLLIILTPFAKEEDRGQGYELTPIIMYGEEVEKGLITSATTRREGIVGNVDIAPTILSYLNLEKINMIGQSMTVTPNEDSLETLLELNEFTVATSKNRLPVLRAYVVFQVLLLLIGLIGILFKSKIKKKYHSFIHKLTLSGMVVPVVLLFLPILRIKSLPMTFIIIIFFTTAISWVLYFIGHKLNRPIMPIFLVSLLMSIGLMVDIILGSPMIRTSVLGYDPIIGARYYGVGNEFMGILIGSSLVFFLSLKEEFNMPKGVIIPLLLLLIAVVGYPQWGANVGGTITATAGAVFVIFRLFNVKIGWKHLLLMGIGVILIVALMAIVDTFIMENQSHLAGAISSIREGGILELIMIITRKITMNLRLIRVTIWSRVLIASMIVFAILFYRPKGLLKQAINKYPFLSIGWAGIVVSSIVTFMVNDSGIVAAATCMIFLSFSLLYLLIEEPHNS